MEAPGSLKAEILSRYEGRVFKEPTEKDRVFLNLNSETCKNLTLPPDITDLADGLPYTIILNEAPLVTLNFIREGDDYSVEIHSGERPTNLKEVPINSDYEIDREPSLLARFRMQYDDKWYRDQKGEGHKPVFFLAHRIVKPAFRGVQSKEGHRLSDLSLRILQDFIAHNLDKGMRHSASRIVLAPCQLSVMCWLLENGFHVEDASKDLWERIENGDPILAIGSREVVCKKDDLENFTRGSLVGGIRVRFFKDILPSGKRIDEERAATKAKVDI